MSQDVHSIFHGDDTLFGQLQQNDITQIALTYSDNTNENFFVAWEDAGIGGYTNRLQISSIDGDGLLKVRIEADREKETVWTDTQKKS